VVIEATGVPAVWETAIACARPGNSQLVRGCPRDTSITVNTEQLHSELTLKGVFHNTRYGRCAVTAGESSYFV